MTMMSNSKCKQNGNQQHQHDCLMMRANQKLLRGLGRKNED